MGKNKKPKKAYKPKTVFVPSIFNSMLTFEPIEQALKRIVETGTMMLDEHDIPIYMDLTGNRQSIESGLKTYKLLIKQHSTEQGHPIILRPKARCFLARFPALQKVEEELDALVLWSVA